MTVIRNVKNYYDDEDRNRSDRMVYDLNEEKKRIAEATEEIKKELLEKWQKRYAGAQIFPSSLNNVNPNLIDFLLSFNNTLFYNDLAKKFNLSQEQRDILPQIIWHIAINKNWSEADNLIREKLNLNSNSSSQIIQLINQNILIKAKELSESNFIPQRKNIHKQEEEKKNVNLSLSQALQRYPQIGEQAITSAPIKLKIFPSPARPSVKNWIEDYRGAMGAEKHGMMERGNYLFHSENGKKLAPGERKKLAEILRSLDEDVTLSVDPDRQEIIFQQEENIESLNRKAQITKSKQSANYKSQSLNFPHSENRPHPNSLPRGEGEFGRLSQNIPNPKSQISNQDTVRFSSSHTLPSERSDLANHESRSMNRGNEQNQNIEPKIRGNIVDLKN